MAASLRKVIVRSQGGEITGGFVDQKKIGDKFTILDRDAEQQSFELSDVKAIFFVKDFKGNPEYEEIRFLNKKQASGAVWVRAEFSDGETIEGRVENNLNLINAPGFYLWPSDQEANNECAYISKSALVEFQILSAD